LVLAWLMALRKAVAEFTFTTVPMVNSHGETMFA